MGDRIPSILFAPGASGSPARITPFITGLRNLGLAAEPLSIPRGAAATVARKVGARLPDDRPLVLAGHSFGGRVASLLAAEGRASIRGLVCCSYPLHRPGRPETGLRTEHWPSIRCPVLLLSGERDPFARLDLLRAAIALLGDGELVTYPGLGHDLRPVADDVCRRIAAFVARLAGSPSDARAASDGAPNG